MFPCFTVRSSRYGYSDLCFVWLLGIEKKKMKILKAVLELDLIGLDIAT